MALNYNRLRYFWMVVREGTLRKAAERLHVSEPAVSVQLRKLQRWIGEPLLRKEGRRLVLTELGQVVYQYAEQIFSLGEELVDVVRGRARAGSLVLGVGITQTIPKMLAEQLLAPAFDAGDFRMRVVEGRLDRLVADLALHQLDVILSDEAVAENPSVRVYSHLLGRCGVTLMATPALRKSLGDDVVAGLRTGPWLLPAEGSPVRRDLDRWFALEELRPRVLAEFQDTALMKAFGGEGRGVVAVPGAVEAEVGAQYGLVPILHLPGVEENFYAITAERKISHPGVAAILREAPASAFGHPSLPGSPRSAGS